MGDRANIYLVDTDNTYPDHGIYLYTPYPITVVDLPNRTVAWAAEGSEKNRDAWYGHVSFERFVALTKADYPKE